MKKIYSYLYVIIAISAFACGNSHGIKTPSFAMDLAKKHDNKLYLKFDSSKFDSVFKLKLANFKSLNPKDLERFYQQHQNFPVIFNKFYLNAQLKSFVNTLQEIKNQGFDPNFFKVNKINENIDLFDQNEFKSIDAVYETLSDLELQSAESILNYTNFMKYGCVNPRNIYDRFRVPIDLPNESKNIKSLNVSNLDSLAKALTPKNTTYLALQKEYLRLKNAGGEATLLRKLLVNMERNRWAIPPIKSQVVMVNIPAFSLKWINGDSTLTEMRVCVGKKIESDYDEKMQTYLKSKDINDKPSNHETSILMSAIKTVQINPVWNIPPSIAKREIYNLAKNDRYYLANSNIKVYKHGRLIGNTDTIKWRNYTQDKLPFTFKQAPGDNNALGKFKFIFANNDGLYLHDTNSKSAFGRSNRAVSHGCVRIQDPLKFAQLLMGDAQLYDKMRIAVNLKPIDSTNFKMYDKHILEIKDTLKKFVLKPVTYSGKNPVQLYITYQTAFLNPQKKIIYADDIYQLDDKIYDKLKKYILK